MRNNLKHLLGVAVLSACLFSCPAVDLSAQRTSKDQFLITGSVTTPAFSSVGGEVSFGRYLRYSYWSAGVMTENPSVALSSAAQRAQFNLFAGYGSFMYRVIKTPTRVFNVYAGADVFLGMEALDVYARLTEEAYKALLNEGYQASRFIYGGGLRVELEFFPLRRWALVMPLRVSAKGNSGSGQIFGYSFGLGVRYNL